MACRRRRRHYLSLGSGVVSGTFSVDLWDGGRVPHADRSVRRLPARDRAALRNAAGGLGRSNSRRSLGLRAGAAGSRDRCRQRQPAADALLVRCYEPLLGRSSARHDLGLSLDHKPAHLFRAALEGIAFEQAVATAAMEVRIGRHSQAMTVAGGGTNSTLMLRIMAVGARSAVARSRPSTKLPPWARRCSPQLLSAGIPASKRRPAWRWLTSPTRRIDPDRGLGQYLWCSARRSTVTSTQPRRIEPLDPDGAGLGQQPAGRALVRDQHRDIECGERRAHDRYFFASARGEHDVADFRKMLERERHRRGG